VKAVSLFSGCGGLDLGLERAGFEIALANDNSARCAESHALNRPATHFYLGSVADLTTRRLKKLLKTDYGDIDLLAGGPPCPPYSKSRFYRKDKPRALEDPVGEVTMNGYLSVLKSLRPRAFMMENVPGLAYKVHRDALDHIVGYAEKLGYTCEGKVINAADYGVPQIRERFFLVGMRGARFAFPEATHAKDPGVQPLFSRTRPWVPVGTVLRDLDTEKNASDEGHFAGGAFHEQLRQVPPGDNYLFFTEERGHPRPLWKWRSRYWSFLLKLSPEMPSWTIQARRSNNMGPFHWRNRILRIEEIKRIQTFPDDWKLAGTVEEQWRQIGNAVPPLLGEQLGRALLQQLKAALAA
jgi:DNA (cytosine-5)-methyltransferase 1